MKRQGVLFVLLSVAMLVIAQPKNIKYEKQDFLLNVLTNPELSLCQFKDVGLNTSNTCLRDEASYVNLESNTFHNMMIKAVGKDDYKTRVTTYRKIAASWRVFKEIQYRNECVDVPFYINDISAPKIDAETKHKLSIVPLKLVYY